MDCCGDIIHQMKINKYIYLVIAVIFIILISLVSYYLGINTAGNKISTKLSEEPTMTPVLSIAEKIEESTISATPEEINPSITSGLKVSIMPRISLVLKISPTMTPTPTSKLILNPNLQKQVSIPSPTPTVMIKISPVRIINQ